MKRKTPDSIQSWLKKSRTQYALTYRFIPFKDSKEWSFTDGILHHKTNRFFSIVGIQWDHLGKIIYQPIIRQTDIGTLGFLLRVNKKEKELLVQAKVEPGNMKEVQLAPTCQATSSNISQTHHGEKPPYSEFFENNQYLHSSLQSEQGTRFLGKRNLNVLRLVSQNVPVLPFHKWIPTNTVFSLVDSDYLINTDARSVLISSFWDQLVNRAPFTRYKTDFADDLYRSYFTTESLLDTRFIVNKLIQMRKEINPPTILTLDNLSGWRITKDAIQPLEKNRFQIKQIEVSTNGREVPHWDQPLIDSKTKGKIDLACGRIDGILHFLFKPQVEPGLYNKVELGPSAIVEPGTSSRGMDRKNGWVIRASCKQSEEGGRFFKDINHYRIIDIGNVREQQDNEFWLTLSQVQDLLLKEGFFTNESRSILSLILKWL